MSQNDDDRTIPIYAEQIEVSKVAAISDHMRIRTNVHERPVLIEDELDRGVLSVERVALDVAVARAPEPRQAGDTLILSIVEERLVVEKRLFVIEEVRITRTTVTEPVSIHETVRTTQVAIERTDQASSTGSEIDG